MTAQPCKLCENNFTTAAASSGVCSTICEDCCKKRKCPDCNEERSKKASQLKTLLIKVAKTLKDGDQIVIRANKQISIINIEDGHLDIIGTL